MAKNKENKFKDIDKEFDWINHFREEWFLCILHQFGKDEAFFFYKESGIKLFFLYTKIISMEDKHGNN